MNEWPLISFTLLLQASIGLTLLSVIFVTWLKSERGEEQGYKAIFPALLIAGGIGIVGLLASLGHLGVVSHAPFAVANAASSWLSREILMTGAYLGLLLITILLAVRSKKINIDLLWLVAITGLLDVYCMGSVYYSTVVITWGHINTYTMFYGTVFVLGGSLANLVITARIAKNTDNALVNQMLGTSLVFIAVGVLGRLLIQPAYTDFLNKVGQLNEAVTFPYNAMGMFEASSTIRTIGWGMTVLGLALMILGCFKPYLNKQNKQKVMANASTLTTGTALQGGVAIMLVACAVMIVAEFLLRYSFFNI